MLAEKANLPEIGIIHSAHVSVDASQDLTYHVLEAFSNLDTSERERSQD
jgi:hypothetical protein